MTFENLLSVADELLQYDEAAMERFFAFTVHDNVDASFDLLGQRSFAILRATGAMEFLIGDIPALTINVTAEGAGPLGGVP